MVISGGGFALLFSTIAATVLQSIPQADFTRGVAIFKLTLTTGGAVASTALTALVRRTTYHLTQLAGSETLASSPAATFLRESTHAALALLVAQQGAVLAYADTALYTAVAVLCVAPLAVVLRPPAAPRA